MRVVCCWARHATASRRGVPGEAWHRQQQNKAWHCSRRANLAVTTVGRDVPYMHPGKACCRHRATRGAAANAAVACRRRRTVCPLVFKQLVGRQSPHVAAGMKHHLRLHCQLVESNLRVLTSVPDQILYIYIYIYIYIYMRWIIFAKISSLNTRSLIMILFTDESPSSSKS